MLQGAFTPPYWPALPAQRFGSTSLCGGARSNCAHPQNISRGKNIRDGGSAFWGVLTDCVVCDRLKTETNTGNARIHANIFIPPPKICKPHGNSEVCPARPSAASSDSHLVAFRQDPDGSATL